MVKISQEHIRSWTTLVPPAAEQRAIADSLDKAIQVLDTAAGELRASTSRLQEYRQALITAAVTGKLNVSAHEHTKES